MQADDDDPEQFRAAMAGVQPLRTPLRAATKRKRIAPRAQFAAAERSAVLEASLDLSASDLDVETGDELSFRRAGVQDGVLRKLRRGHYRVEAELDLHGFTGEQSRAELRRFIARAIASQRRCIRIVHGKGLRSGPRGPVLKHTVNYVLRRVAAVLAFCSARQVDGGTGAIYVLLSLRQ